ncbi:MAG TPA: hypothetical protein VIK01_26690 [Polyangiaceae bacterium]
MTTPDETESKPLAGEVDEHAPATPPLDRPQRILFGFGFALDRDLLPPEPARARGMRLTRDPLPARLDSLPIEAGK